MNRCSALTPPQLYRRAHRCEKRHNTQRIEVGELVAWLCPHHLGAYTRGSALWVRQGTIYVYFCAPRAVPA